MPHSIPSWVETTPVDTGYELTIWVDSTAVEEIPLTRDEYMRLKLHLAVMRGHVQQGETPEQFTMLSPIPKAMDAMEQGRRDYESVVSKRGRRNG